MEVVRLRFCYILADVTIIPKYMVFACSCPDLPTPFAEESIFTPFYACGLFVEY